jgi:asparagine synthase (glutamine-hydrolysing)
MCGIAGAISLGRTRPDVVAGMLAALRHRGPDDSGLWTSEDARVTLGQRRLAIIDLTPSGRNPMAWDGGRLWITYNGEIYNFRELRRELEGEGYSFRTRTDTEVILASYDRWGVKCLEKLVGMFAFALWDSSSDRLFLARDRLGKKPLYYSVDRGRLVFASELKAILVDPDFPGKIDPDSLSLYLRYGYVPSPHSIFQAVRSLPPAHYALYEKGKLAVERYWDPIGIALGERFQGDEREAERELERLVTEAVRGRMIADVPLGAFLSGGIDSSLIVALMQEQSTKPVLTFTVRFDNPEFNEADDAAAVARHLGTEHHEETCSTAEMLGLLDAVAGQLDEPFADSSAIPTHLVSKITRRHVTVALSGDGGDELFFGYPRYHAEARQGWLLSAPRPLRLLAAMLADSVPRRRFRRAAQVLRTDSVDGYDRFVTLWSPAEVARLTRRPAIENAVYRQTFERVEPISRQQRPPLIDLVTYLPEDILTKVDRMSMAVSLETRCPLLDHRVVEFALRLPLEMKWHGGRGKWLLRRILYRRVPRELLERPKMGFGVPLADWFRGPLRASMEERIAGAVLEDLGLDPVPARAVWRDFLSGRSHRTDLVWSLYALMLWAERWTAARVRSDCSGGTRLAFRSPSISST